MFNSPNKKPIASLATNPPTPTNIPTITPNAINPTKITPTTEPIKSNTKIQIIKATYGPPLGFSPNELTVRVGSPVRLEISATIDGRGCMSTIIIPGLDNRIQTLVKGQTNIFEFTPQTPGEYPITCAMGMSHRAVIIVQ